MRARSLVVSLALVALGAAGCASVKSVADREFEAGNYAAAAAAYEEALRSEPAARRDPALRLRLGLAYAMPGSAHDPARAVEVLRAMPGLFPRSWAAAQAVLVVPLLEEERRLADELAAARLQLVALEGALQEKDEQAQRLRTTLADTQAQLHRVREELEQLKRIDLQRNP
jgi:chromosome condensin MukBEF ATPase and DNA-binding subunit MukB